MHEELSRTMPLRQICIYLEPIMKLIASHQHYTCENSTKHIFIQQDLEMEIIGITYTRHILYRSKVQKVLAKPWVSLLQSNGICLSIRVFICINRMPLYILYNYIAYYITYLFASIYLNLLLKSEEQGAHIVHIEIQSVYGFCL